MARRLREWLEKNEKLNESQNGFREKRSTRDHIFVLNSLIGKRLKEKGGKLYVAFVDFKAAFDMVDRDLIIEKMRRLGIKGRIVKMVKSIYSKTTNEVITQEGCTEKFETKRGVRQGCPLSPTLFNIFLDDLDAEWKRRNEGGIVVGQTKIFALKFADDVAIVAEDAVGLNAMLRSLSRYVDRNRMKVNVAKTKVMVFRNGGRRKRREVWKYGQSEIEEVGNYKYLGFTYTTKNSYSKHLRTLASKAQVAANAAWGVMRRANISSLKRRGYLLDTLIKTILMYGVEIWGWQERQEIENMAGRYTKMMLGVHKCTPAYIWRMESGRRKVEVEARRRAFRYLLDIFKMRNERWPKICLKEELREWTNGKASKFLKEIEAAMQRAGDGQTIRELREGLDTQVLTIRMNEACKIIGDQTTQGDWNRIDISRYCPGYQEWKSTVGPEKYWEEKDIKIRDKEQWARIRCGNIGRGGNKGYRDARCRLCGGEKEEIEHILNCREFKREVNADLKRDVENISRRHGQLSTILQGPIQPKICEYYRVFERVAKAKELEELRKDIMGC